jgi:hypothetical protein
MDGFITSMGTSLPGFTGTGPASNEGMHALPTDETKMKSSLAMRFKKEFARFKKDPAGSRFENLYKRSRKLSPWVRVTAGGLGFALGICGLALGLIPGVPGIFLGAAGFALVAAQFKPVAVGADRTEVAVRNFWQDVRGHLAFLKTSKTGRIHRVHHHRKNVPRRSQRSKAIAAG